MSMHDNSLPANVRESLERGSTIEAIKLLREATGLGLKEAKERIDRHHQGDAASGPTAAPLASLPPEVAAAMKQGNKIEAIRMLREKTGLGLKEAKEAVESIQTDTSSLRAPGEVARSGIGMWLVAALVAVAVLAYVVFRRFG